MNNITKYLLIFLLIVAVIFGGYYYFKFQSVQDKELNDIEEREQIRTVNIDSIQRRNEDLAKSIDSLSLEIIKLKAYEPPKVDNTDLPDATSRELDSILTSYYKQ